MKFSDYLQRVQSFYTQMGVELTFAPPAPMRHLQTLEERCNFMLPAEVRAAWLISNGVGDGNTIFVRPGYLTGYQFLSVKGAFMTREAMRKRAPKYGAYVGPGIRDPRIQCGWFQTGWLPFAGYDGGKLLLILDFSPTVLGMPGQIIGFTHDPDKIDYIAPSFEQLLLDSLPAFEFEAG